MQNKNKNMIIAILIGFLIISIITIYSASLSYSNKEILSKQLIWYLVGFLLIFTFRKINIKKIINNAWFYYIGINIILLLLLIFGREINGSKCWFIIPKIGSIQPSEFAKIILILINTKIFNDYNKKHPSRTIIDDIKLFLLITLVTLIPGILTFLQPDTGMVIIYFLISYVMLFIFGIRKSIFLVIILFVMITVGSFLYFYFNYQSDFINLFGTSFFYRIDRLLDWSNKSGMQLTNALAAIKAAGIKGYGIGNTPIYIPEAHTDFIFSVYANNFGLIGVLILVSIIILFDLKLLLLSINTNNKDYKFIIVGFLTMILYQQIQNIGMNIGLLPITGITLPFISYGGSSLLSYIIIIGIILNYENIVMKK